MMNHTLEADLKEYCKTLNGELFAEKLYQPLCNLAVSILNKNNYGLKREIDELIQDMVAEASIKLPKYYNSEKGTAKVMAYIIMKQFLCHEAIYNSKAKRNLTKKMYIEDIENEAGSICHVIEVEIDEMHLKRNSLLQNEAIFEKLRSALHKKVANTIIDCIKHPENYKCDKFSYINAIAKQHKTTPTTVYNVIRAMRDLMFKFENEEVNTNYC